MNLEAVYKFNDKYFIADGENKILLFELNDDEYLFEVEGMSVDILRIIHDLGDTGIDLETLKKESCKKMNPPLKAFDSLFDEFINSLIENHIILSKK